MKKDTSGPAFARNVDIKEAYELNVDQMEKIIGDTSGLSKREYFAAKAMQGFVSDPDMVDAFANSSKSVLDADELIARHSVWLVDALIKELEK